MIENILIVDDEPEMTALLKKFLQRKGYNVSCAANRDEFFHKLEEFKPDLITMDILMPGEHGFQIIEELKDDEKNSDIPIIIISVRADIAREKGKEAGAAAVFSKPLEFEKLYNVIEKIENNQKEESIAGKKVLVVDDEHDSVLLLERILEKEGCIIDTASGGVQGFEKAKQELPDIIIIDINMSGMNGIELLQNIRAYQKLKDIPIMMYSACNEDIYKEKSIKCGATGFVAKLQGPEELVKKLKKFLKKKRIVAYE